MIVLFKWLLNKINFLFLRVCVVGFCMKSSDEMID